MEDLNQTILLKSVKMTSTMKNTQAQFVLIHRYQYI